MLGNHGIRTYSNYQYSHNQLSADNPFRYMGTTYDPYQPKASNQIKYTYSKEYQNPKKEEAYQSSSRINENKKRNISPTYLKNNTFNIINSKSYSKNSQQNYSLYTQNRDHVGELFNYSKEKPKDFYSGSTTNKNAQQFPYSTYTTPKLKSKKNRYFNNTNFDEISYEMKNEKISNPEIPEYYEENCNLIKNYAYKENPNLIYRDYMEDKGISIMNINGDPDKALFCLFDGHGGDQVSKFLQNNFLKYFKEILPFGNIKENLIKLFKKLDEKIKDLNCYQIGSTACIIYITKEKGQKILYSANIGDTRSILISKNEYKRLSYDHRASDSNEYKRIINEGGIVFNDRVYGSLMLSRAFGDLELKPYGVICEPFVNRIEINENDKFVIIATDGVWDIFNDADVYEISQKFDNSKDLCNTLVNKSIEKDSTDNISCFVIKL